MPGSRSPSPTAPRSWRPRTPSSSHPRAESAPGRSATSTSPTRAWALERLHEPLVLADLAAHARMSVRTFTRRFRDEVGLTPGQWLTGQRVAHARQLLESSDLPIDRVAAMAGF